MDRDYASKVLQVLSLSPEAPALIRKYVRTVKPPLTEPNDIKLFALALADSSLPEAWAFQRTFNERSEIRSRLLRSLLEWCVSREFDVCLLFFEFFVLNVSSEKPRSTAMTDLLELSLSSFEESTIHSIVLSPPSSFPLDALPLLQDLICIRLIQLGKFLDAIRMGRQFSTSKPVINARRTEARLKMVEDLYRVLPSSYRALIDLELADPSPYTVEPQKSFGVEVAQPLEQVQSSEFQASASILVDLGLANAEPQRSPVSRSAPGHTNASGTGRPIPVSTSPQLPATTSPVTPRQNSHISTLVSSSSIRSRASLGNTAERLACGSTSSHVSSPLSGVKLPSSPIQSRKLDGNGFISAQQQTNAFYTPPKINDLTQPTFSPRTILSHSGNGNAEKPLSEQDDDVGMDDVDMEEKMEGENDKERDYEHEIEHQREKQAESVSTEKGIEEIGYSLFDSGLPSRPYLENEPPKSSDVADAMESPSASTKRKVPGSFNDKDGDVDEGEEPEAGDANQSYYRHRHHEREKLSTLPEYEEAQFADDYVTRLEPRYTTENPVSRKKPRGGSKEPKKRRISQQELPGGLMDDGKEEEEEEDYVAPLRNTKPPSRRSKPISRRSTSEISDDIAEGVQTRRRSSRLNTTTSAGGATVVPSVDGVDASLRKSSRTRKPTSKSTRGKKRGGA